LLEFEVSDIGMNLAESEPLRLLSFDDRASEEIDRPVFLRLMQINVQYAKKTGSF
jgi:hypothetical protein